ncbi:hypothetical protein J6590_089859 [Homalodisca vitripennis]|nr:hypothetical protein J6590_089859 [Homalodisca vitripennis]
MNRQTRLKRLRETRRRTKLQPVNIIKKKVRQQPVNVIKKKVRASHNEETYYSVEKNKTWMIYYSLFLLCITHFSWNFVPLMLMRKRIFGPLPFYENEQESDVNGPNDEKESDGPNGREKD